MFKERTSQQLDMFMETSSYLSCRKAKILHDPNSWNNLFRNEVIRRIDEQTFSVLFSNDNGRPNAPVQVLIGMIILKEGNGWSDEQLFDQCRYNLQIMNALGLMHIDDDVPVESTYYKFRQRLALYNEKKGCDLINQCFKGVTAEQIASHKILGEKVRLDSKLIQSNIMRSTRVELVLEALRSFIVHLNLEHVLQTLSNEDVLLLDELKRRTVSNITYPKSNEEKKNLLEQAGGIIKQLLNEFQAAPGRKVLERIYQDHYEEKPSKDDPDTFIPHLTSGKEMPTSSIQSVHDPDAAFRRKGEGHNVQQVSGYHAGITETCSENNKINLITDVQVAPANVSESELMIPGLEGSEEVLRCADKTKSEAVGESVIKHVTTDGGYDSHDVRNYMKAQKDQHWNMGKHKGQKLRYNIIKDEKENIKVTCATTGAECQISFSEKAGKYVIKQRGHSTRYITREQLESYIELIQHHASQRPEDVNIRANVESTIHQVFHRLGRRMKIKYRGLFKCKMYVIARAMWTNYRRIRQKEIEMAYILLIFIIYSSRKFHKIQIPINICQNDFIRYSG